MDPYEHHYWDRHPDLAEADVETVCQAWIRYHTDTEDRISVELTTPTTTTML